MWSCQKCGITFITVKSPINRLVIIKKGMRVDNWWFLNFISLWKRGTITRKEVYGSRSEWPWRTCLENVPIYFSIIQNLKIFTCLLMYIIPKRYSRASLHCLNWADSTLDLTPAKYNVNVSNFPKFSRKKAEQNSKHFADLKLSTLYFLA